LLTVDELRQTLSPARCQNQPGNTIILAVPLALAVYRPTAPLLARFDFKAQTGTREEEVHDTVSELELPVKHRSALHQEVLNHELAPGFVGVVELATGK
jgi:hypothetical protein